MKIVKLALPFALLCFLTFGGVAASASNAHPTTGNGPTLNPALNPADAISGTIYPRTKNGKLMIAADGSIGYCIWTLYKPYYSSSIGKVDGYGNLNCYNASTYQIKITLCLNHLTWPFWITNSPCYSQGPVGAPFLEGDVLGCTTGQHDWRTWAHFEVWFTGNTYGDAQPYSATPNPSWNIPYCPP